MGDENFSFGFFTNVKNILIKTKWIKNETS
jgi:hypothetical protein